MCYAEWWYDVKMQVESQEVNNQTVKQGRSILLFKSFPAVSLGILIVAIAILLVGLGKMMRDECDYVEYPLSLSENLRDAQLHLLGDAYVVTRPSHEGCGKGLSGVSREMESAWAMRIPGGGADYYERYGRTVEKYTEDRTFTIKEAVLEVASCRTFVLDRCSRLVFLRLEDVHGMQYEVFTGWLPSDSGTVEEGELKFTYASSGGTQERLSSTYFDNLAAQQQ